MKNLINYLSKPETTGKKIGLFRIICAIFGGLISAYLIMTLFVFLIPGSVGESIVVPLLFNTLLWAILAFWISLSSSKIIALLRAFIPCFICIFILTFLYLG